jgi:flagellin
MGEQRANQVSDGVSVLNPNNQLGADIRIANQSKRNANDGISYLQEADRVMDEVTRLLTRAAELVEQAKVDTISNSTRASIEAEFQFVISAINDIVEKTTFHGAPVFTPTVAPVPCDSPSTISFTIGTIGDVAGFTLGISATTRALTSPDGLDATGLAILNALDSANSLRSALGASMRKQASVSNILGIQVENFSAAFTQIRDANIAEEVANLTKFQILKQSGTNPWGQTNRASGQILSLLQIFQPGRLEFRGRDEASFSRIAG